MKLATCLAFTGVNRNTYDTLNRRFRRPDGAGGLTFMQKRLIETDGQDRYTLAHAVALACFVDLRDAGVAPAHALTVIDETFDYIADQVELLAENPEHLKRETLIRYFPDPNGHYGWSVGASDSNSLRPSNDNVISIDLSSVIQRIWNAASRWLGIKVA